MAASLIASRDGGARAAPADRVVQASMARRVNREVVVLLGWGRAILLQVAHPLVAAGVAEHSDFRKGTLSYVRRTRRTVGAMLGLTFGSAEEIRTRADRIKAIHRRVHGILRGPTGHFQAGTPYSATDPELLRWVHATIVDSQLRAYQLFVGALTVDEQDQYCAEATGIAPLLGIPDAFLPASTMELDRYLGDMLASGVIEVTETARALARALLFPPGGALTGPLLWLGRLTTIGLLPPTIRAAYGFEWGESGDRRLRRACRSVRGVVRLVPPALREWPAARATDP